MSQNVFKWKFAPVILDSQVHLSLRCAPSVSYLFRQEHSFTIYGLFWLLAWRERAKCRCVIHFFPSRTLGVKDGCTKLCCVHRCTSLATPLRTESERELLKYESLTPNLQFISVKIQSQLSRLHQHRRGAGGKSVEKVFLQGTRENLFRFNINQ